MATTKVKSLLQFLHTDMSKRLTVDIDCLIIMQISFFVRVKGKFLYSKDQQNSLFLKIKYKKRKTSKVMLFYSYTKTS